MTVYNIGEYTRGYKQGFDDGIKECIEILKEMNKLEHIATIDFCYWRLKILCEQLSKPKSNIKIMVDNACGYNETEEIRKECIILLEQIIESKKAISADYLGIASF